MDKKTLALKALIGVISTPFIFGLPIFLSAGTLDYWQAWLFICVFSITTALHTIYLVRKDPELLARRMHIGPKAEERPAQRIIIILFFIAFFLLLIVSGLDHRFGWSSVPAAIAVAGDALIVLSYVVFYIVMRANHYAAATIRVDKEQPLVSSGIYGLVRHPMYAGAVVLMIGMPLALGSVWALLIMLAALPLLHLRIVDEEKCLNTELTGYRDYCTKVKFRLLPGLY